MQKLIAVVIATDFICWVPVCLLYFRAKMFEFRRITLFCLEKRLSKHKMTIFSESLGEPWPLWPPGLHPCLYYYHSFMHMAKRMLILPQKWWLRSRYYVSWCVSSVLDTSKLLPYESHCQRGNCPKVRMNDLQIMYIPAFLGAMSFSIATPRFPCRKQEHSLPCVFCSATNSHEVSPKSLFRYCC